MQFPTNFNVGTDVRRAASAFATGSVVGSTASAALAKKVVSSTLAKVATKQSFKLAAGAAVKGCVQEGRCIADGGGSCCCNLRAFRSDCDLVRGRRGGPSPGLEPTSCLLRLTKALSPRRHEGRHPRHAQWSARRNLARISEASKLSSQITSPRRSRARWTGYSCPAATDCDTETCDLSVLVQPKAVQTAEADLAYVRCNSDFVPRAARKLSHRRAVSPRNQPMGYRDQEWLLWVAMRLTSLRVRRRKVVVEVSLPGSSRSSPSADDPDLTVADWNSWGLLPGRTRRSRATLPLLENLADVRPPSH